MEPEISPLAKRLAEENNVQWQVLAGSGAEGRILERDVLEYLARVMAGDEALNPTPEPTPEGMEAWPEEDVQNYFEEVKTESGSPAPDWSSDSSAEASEDLLSTDAEDDLLFAEDEQAIETPDQTDDDIFVFEDTGESVAEEPIEAIEAKEVAIVSEEVSEDMFSEDLDDIEFDDDVASIFVDDADAQDGISLEAESDGAFVEQPDIEAQADVIEPDEIDFGEELDDAAELEPEVSDLQLEEAEPVEFEAVEPETVEPEAIQHEATEPESFEPDVFEPEAVSLESDESESSGDHIADIAAASAVGVAAAVTMGAGDSEQIVQEREEGTGLPLSSYGVLLRRHVDLTALLQAQTDLNTDLGESVSASALLLRAAAKAAKGSFAGEIGMAELAEGVSIKAVQNAGSQSFSDLIASLGSGSSAEAEELSLVIADLTSHGIDEAVLNLGVPVLALGRVLYDSSAGSQLSTLSLSGEVSVTEGTELLSAVADLLETPVRLLI